MDDPRDEEPYEFELIVTCKVILDSNDSPKNRWAVIEQAIEEVTKEILKIDYVKSVE